MRQIPLTRGQVAIVDDGDYDYLMQWKWCARWSVNTQMFYAGRGYRVNGRHMEAKMHRQLLGLDRGDKRQVDHINHNPLDNRRCNLRICTHAQNLWNMQKRTRNKSGHTGVYWDTKRQKWHVQFRANNVVHDLGRFDSLEEAIAARKAQVMEVRGEFNYVEVA